jgi:hypothetical protein
MSIQEIISIIAGLQVFLARCPWLAIGNQVEVQQAITRDGLRHAVSACV